MIQHKRDKMCELFDAMSIKDSLCAVKKIKKLTEVDKRKGRECYSGRKQSNRY